MAPPCKVFNTFVDVFSHKFLTLLDGMEKCFLWGVAVALHGRKIGFDWLKLVWEHDGE